VSKVKIGPMAQIYPMPALLVGADVDQKPNFMAVGSHGVASLEPAMISVAIRHKRHTLTGIRQNMAFSVNLPSLDAIPETDYCGIVSGSKEDKVRACNFRVFYGKLAGVPLIEQCPLNLECKVAHMLDLGSHGLVIGTVEETHITEDCLTNGKPDTDKMRPFIYVTAPSRRYQALGEVAATAYSIGTRIKQS